MITAGIDCGAKTTKAVIVKDGRIIGRGTTLTGFDQEKAVEACLEAALEDAGIKREDIRSIYGTGSGREFDRDRH